MSSLNLGLRILGAVQERKAVTLKDLRDELNLSRSTLYRYLLPLVDEGYLIRIRGVVIPGDRLAPSDSTSEHVVSVARPIMMQLRARTGLSALLTVRIHTVGVCLFSVTAHPKHLITLRQGEIQPLYAGASVTPLLAYAPPEIVAAVKATPSRKSTSMTPTPDDASRGLDQIRRDGYALTYGELTPGMGAIGMPVLLDGNCVCVLSLVGPGKDLTEPEPIIDDLRTAATHLARRLRQESAGGLWATGGDEYV